MKKTTLQPEQSVLAAVLILFGIGLACLGFTLPETGELQPSAGAKAPDAIAFEKLETISEQIKKPVPIVEVDKKKPVFVSRLIVYSPASGEIGPLDESKEIVGVGIPPGWLIAHQLSIEDPAVGEQDPDGDGFSNLEEYKAKTDPQLASSQPPIITKLAVKKYNYVPFKIEFKGRTQGADGLQFQLSFKGSSKLLKEGDIIEGYQISSYREKLTKKFNDKTNIEESIDESELDLTYLKLGEVITLVLRQSQESNESNVEFVLQVPGGKVEPAIVKRGDTFKVREKTYQMIKATSEAAIIRDTEEKNKEKTITVPMAK
jgi:hypothetical protein